LSEVAGVWLSVLSSLIAPEGLFATAQGVVTSRGEGLCHANVASIVF